ncbi:MAG: rhodanese-like domain-containing protein [Campylobacterota bacterium]|nr:rhodanese-like domain-containing protein [Campylobacterota bacterium]
MKKIVTTSLLLASLTVSAFAYDANKAKMHDAFYSNFTQKACAKSKLFIDAQETMDMLNKKEKFTFLDIRTKGEHAVVSVGLENSLFIPLEDLFKKENLDKLPTDQTIVVACHSGTRGILSVVGLKQIGFKNVRVLKGGVAALALANTVKNAPLK